MASAPGTRVPNLFIVGAPRCASTSFYGYLAQHPDIFMPDTKEPRFYCSDLDTGRPLDEGFFIRDRAEYLALFTAATDQRYVGEGCIFNLFSAVAAERIHADSPDARILALLRDPVEQMYSFHSVRRRNGTEDLDFAAALAAEPERAAGRRLPRRARNEKMYQYRAVASYAAQLERYLDRFGRDRVHVIVYEDLVRDVPGAYRATLEFLGIDPTFVADFTARNPHQVTRSSALARVLVRDERAVARARRLLPGPVRALAGAARRRLMSWNLRPAPRESLDPALAERLRAEFAVEVDRLGDVLGRDLHAVWG